MTVKKLCLVALVSTILTVFTVATAEETYTVETPDDNVEANRSTVDAFPQQVSLISNDVLVEVNQIAAAGPDFVRIFLPDVVNPDLKAYDEAFQLWQKTRSEDPNAISEAAVINIIGSYLGNRLVSDLNMEWVEVEDQYGTNYGVRHRGLKVFAYPFSTVQKRVERDEFDFVYNVYYAVKQAVENGSLERQSPPPSE